MALMASMAERSQMRAFSKSMTTISASLDGVKCSEKSLTDPK